jgi:hypothetical protein
MAAGEHSGMNETRVQEQDQVIEKLESMKLTG